jgi:hypothetical protein
LVLMNAAQLAESRNGVWQRSLPVHATVEKLADGLDAVLGLDLGVQRQVVGGDAYPPPSEST